MINAASYTPRESLILITWIRTHGLDAFETPAFQTFSEDLINNDSIKQDPAYDASRLTPGSLRELFLHLLQEELRDDPASAASHDAVPAATETPQSPNTKKRKRPGPAPQVTTLHEARKHVHRLPDAEAKLYAKYKQWAVQKLWEEQEELLRLEEEIKRLERDEREAAKTARAVDEDKTASAGPNTAVNPVKETSRPPSAAQAGDIQDSNSQPNRNGAQSIPPPAPTQVQVAAPKNIVPPPRQVSPTQPAAISTPPRALVQQPVASSGQFAPIKPEESPRPSHPHPPAPASQRPPGVSPLPSQPSLPILPVPPTAETAQNAAGAPKPGTPSNASQSPQLPVPGALKWEPPYQPHPGSQQQRPPPHMAQVPPQRSPHHPQQWAPPGHVQFPHPPPLQPSPQGHSQQLGPAPARPVPVAPHPGPQGPPLQPPPMRSHSGSPAPLPRPPSGPSPLPGQARLPQSPYQKQPVFPPPQTLPPHSRMAPNVSSTPPPLSPAVPPQQGWQKPPAPTQVLPTQVPPTGVPHGQLAGPAFHPGSSVPQPPPYKLPYSQPPPHAVPPHVHSVQVSTPGPGSRRPHPVLPHTPLTMPFTSRGPQGSGTKWKSAQPTPSTPGPAVGHVQSPAFEPLSPVLQLAGLPTSAPKRQPKPAEIDTATAKKGTKAARSAPAGESSRQRRTPSVASPRDDQDFDSATKVKREDVTPRPLEDAGDTTADESVSGRGRRHLGSPRNSRSVGKRKRQDSALSERRTVTEFRPRLPPPPPPGIPTHVLWTRGFPKVSASTLEQISSHKYANMFTHPIKPKEAPGYHSIVLRPTCLKNIQKAIVAGNKAAAAAAAALPDGDPGTNSVWLPINEDLVPPRAIINSAHLERELVHMFANAIMYNLDPNRGPGPAFLKGSGVGTKGANEAHGRTQSHAGGDAANMVGYQVDQDSVVKDTQSMFSEVDKLLIELRSTEAQPGVPPPLLPPGAVPASERLARGSFATASVTDQGHTPSAVGGSLAGDEAEEHHTDREGEGAGGTFKRRRLGRS